jgi:putative sterol carrier protein
MVHLHPHCSQTTSVLLTTNSLDDFPSSAAFDEIARSLSASDADRKDAIKQANAIFAFTLKNSAGTQESWYIDLKESGTVGKGTAPEGKKAAVTLVLSDAEFGKLVQGKANAQKLFMSGKLKVKGDVMKATKMEPILKKAQTQAKL